LFNCLGSIIIYPMRVVPIRLSESLAHLSYRSKVYPFAYILFTFFLLPSFVILVFH